MLIGEPPTTQFDLHFSVAGIPVRVHPFFWLVGLLLGANSGDGVSILIWVAALFVSILVHELGHAFTMRSFGEAPRIVLYMMGGLAIRDSSPLAVGRRRSSPPQHILISAAGPAAGFALAGFVIALVYAGGGAVMLDRSAPGLLPLSIELQRGVPIYRSIFDDPADAGDASGPLAAAPAKNNNYYLYEVIRDLLWINIFWGLVNLLPVYPLDGGQIAREVMVSQDPWDGMRKSLLLSVITGTAAAIGGFLLLGSLFLAIMFGSLAFFNWQVLQQISGRGGGFGGWGGGRPWS